MFTAMTAAAEQYLKSGLADLEQYIEGILQCLPEQVIDDEEFLDTTTALEEFQTYATAYLDLARLQPRH